MPYRPIRTIDIDLLIGFMEPAMRYANCTSVDSCLGEASHVEDPTSDRLLIRFHCNDCNILKSMLLDKRWLNDVEDFISYQLPHIIRAFDPDEREQMKKLYPQFEYIANLLRNVDNR